VLYIIYYKTIIYYRNISAIENEIIKLKNAENKVQVGSCISQNDILNQSLKSIDFENINNYSTSPKLISARNSIAKISKKPNYSPFLDPDNSFFKKNQSFYRPNNENDFPFSSERIDGYESHERFGRYDNYCNYGRQERQIDNKISFKYKIIVENEELRQNILNMERRLIETMKKKDEHINNINRNLLLTKEEAVNLIKESELRNIELEADVIIIYKTIKLLNYIKLYFHY